MGKEGILYVGFAVIGGFAALFGYLEGRTYKPPKLEPRRLEVQEGFVSPSDISITVQDLDGDGELETIATVKGERFLVMYENGNPVFKKYAITPLNPEESD